MVKDADIFFLGDPVRSMALWLLRCMVANLCEENEAVERVKSSNAR
jgi:hypothetical protein